MITISVTGATGDIGGAYIRSLDPSITIKALVRDGSKPTYRSGKDYLFTDGYIYNASFLRDFIKSDTLVHCAALLNTDDNNLIDVFAVNALFTGALVNNAKQCGVKKFIYLSTEMVHTLTDTDTSALSTLAMSFVHFCKDTFSDDRVTYDFRALAREFIGNNSFAYEKYNAYALAKYLGEVIVQSISSAAIVRISNAYGPEYSNSRLIPRMLKGRLTGRLVEFLDEPRDFIYSKDINNLISTIIDNNISGIIEGRSGQMTQTTTVAKMIIDATPTAYGELVTKTKSTQSRQIRKSEQRELADLIEVTPFAAGIAATIRHHKEQSYHQMTDARTIQDFLAPDERVVKMLKGSSAAHLCVVADRNNVRSVRKIAIYDGVEGNGIAKVANEIRYYKYITTHVPGLANMYPKLLDSRMSDDYSSETIEYLDGKNYYQSIKDGAIAASILRKSLHRFVSTLSNCAFTSLQRVEHPDADLDSYYLERSLARLTPIKEIIDIKDTLTINEKTYIAPHIILTDLLTNERLRTLIKPHTKSFCFHGDLTFLNTVFVESSEQIHLIDPRGHIGSWDPLYDVGKLLFTLAGFGELVIGKEPMVTTQKAGGFKIHFDQIPDLSFKLHDELPDIFAANGTFQNTIIAQEPHWRHRIALAQATHFLADIPFRLYTDGTTSTALASYIIGTYYLNQIYETLKREVTAR